MLTRKRQLAAKIEVSEGVAEAPAAADARLLVYNPKVSFDIAMFERNPARQSFSNIGKLPGKRPAGLSFRLELRGSGLAVTAPEWVKLLQACGFGVNQLKSMNIGAITNGPFQHGETITGGTSGAEGRVVINTANGSANIYFVSISGTFESGETIIGGTSTATAITSSVPTIVGNEFKPISDNIPSLTQGSYEDGVRKLLKGCRGKVKLGFKSGEPVLLDFDFQGVEAGVADTAFLANVTYENTKPPVFLSALFSVDAYSAKIGEMDIDVGNTLAGRDDVNDPRGILSFAITGRNVIGSFNPEMVSCAAHDFHSRWFSGAEMIVDFTVGSIAGNKFRFYIPRAQYTKVEDEDRDGLQLAKSAFSLNGSVSPGDDELTVLAL
ncbi:MAG: hypothetical protein HZC16_03665 [Candidatus Omnitrophica bacterium]|nr:hypothetical protein [Candidatus Omnitrophota bacterium]